uniref:Uncharacterized protein n=1 Tax=Megaselia scalaris TaxID=36166 RepID=T1GQ51_MEGSC
MTIPYYYLPIKRELLFTDNTLYMKVKFNLKKYIRLTLTHPTKNFRIYFEKHFHLYVLLRNNIKQVPAILNCILARQLCFEDPSCSAILEIIPRVCGPIPEFKFKNGLFI